MCLQLEKKELESLFQLAEKASRFGKIGRGIASLARVPAMFTPVGLTLMGAEGIMMGMREQERINQMRETDPEAYQEYLADQEDMLRESAAYGGPGVSFVVTILKRFP